MKIGILGKEKKEKEVITPAQAAANARFAMMKQQYQQGSSGSLGTSPSYGYDNASAVGYGGGGGGEYYSPASSLNISPSSSVSSMPPLPQLPPKSLKNSSTQLVVPSNSYTAPSHTAPASYPAPTPSPSLSPSALAARHFSDTQTVGVVASTSPAAFYSPQPPYPRSPSPQPAVRHHGGTIPVPAASVPAPTPTPQFHTRLNFAEQQQPQLQQDYNGNYYPVDNQYQPQPIDFAVVIEELEYDTQTFIKAVSTLEGMVMQIGSKMNDSRSLRGILENQKLVINQVVDHLTYFFTELDKTPFAQTEFVNRFYSARHDFDRAYNIYQHSLAKQAEAIVRYPDPPERSRASVKFTKHRNAGRKVSIYGDYQLQAQLDGDFQFDLSKMMEYDEQEEERKFIEQRNREIQMLLLELEELRDIFAQQADMMVQQGELLETVQRQTEAAEMATRQAVVELAKAQSIDFSRYTKRAMLIGALLGGAAGAIGGMVMLGPVASIPLGIVGAAAGAYIGKKVTGLVVQRLTRTAERQLFQTHLQAAGKWMRDKDVPACLTCKHPFTTFRRRTHCRGCGGIFCHPCCGHMMVVKLETVVYDNPVQVCSNCYQSQN